MVCRAHVEIGSHVDQQQLDRILMVDDHLRLDDALAVRPFTQLDQPLRIQQRVGVSLQSARVPREVDQQATEDTAAVRSCWFVRAARQPDVGEVDSFINSEVPRGVRTIVVEK